MEEPAVKTAFRPALPQNKLFSALKQLRGNARYAILCEPLYSILSALYLPYASLYMHELGLTDGQIGHTVTVGLISQLAGAFLGGIVVDKLGRRRTNLIFDVAAYGISSLLLAFAQGFWWFAVAMAFNGMWQVSSNAWNGLIGEDTPPEQLSLAYTGFYIISQGASFFAPVSILLVQCLSLVPAMRALYFVAALTQSAKAILLYRFTRETPMGLQRMEETKHISWFGMLQSYRGVLRQVFRTPATFLLLSIIVIVNVITVITNNFFSLYITQTLCLPDTLAGYISIIRAALMILFMFGFQNRVNGLPYRPVLSAGMGIYIAAFLSLICSKFSLVGLGAYILLEAVAFAFVSPRKDALLTLFVDKHDRSRIFGMIFVITLGCTSPFGSFIGSLSDSNREYPFFLAIGLCAVCALLVLLVRTGSREGDSA